MPAAQKQSTPYLNFNAARVFSNLRAVLGSHGLRGLESECLASGSVKTSSVTAHSRGLTAEADSDKKLIGAFFLKLLVWQFCLWIGHDRTDGQTAE